MSTGSDGHDIPANQSPSTSMPVDTSYDQDDKVSGKETISNASDDGFSIDIDTFDYKDYISEPEGLGNCEEKTHQSFEMKDIPSNSNPLVEDSSLGIT